MVHRLAMKLDAISILAALAAFAAMLASAAAFAPAGTLLFSFSLGTLLIVLSWIDFRTFRLPDGLTLAVLLLGAWMVWRRMPEEWLDHIFGAVAGYLVLLAVELAYRRMRGRDGLGRGDAKLLGALGMWTGWTGLAPILMVASFSALISVLIISLLRRQSLEGQARIAFGPWIALGGWVVWLARPALKAAGFG